MDGRRFDELTRRMGGEIPRRHVLRGLVGGIAAAVGLSKGVSANGQEKKDLCHRTSDPNTPWVVISVADAAYQKHLDTHGDQPFVDCCEDADCTGYNTCGGGGTPGQCGCTPVCDSETCSDDGCGGTCPCPVNQDCCSGICTDLSTDDANCGSCGAVCESPETCGGDGSPGVCGCTPDPLEVICNGVCSDTRIDNCGNLIFCGPDVCDSGEICGGNGVCCTPSCDGLTCGDDGCGGTCECDPDLFCVGGGCVSCLPENFFGCRDNSECCTGYCTEILGVCVTCLRIGDSCFANDDCCSGFCNGSTCAIN